MVPARLRRCAHCKSVYLYGKAHGGSGRYRYCSAACAELACKAKRPVYHETYYRSEEGKAQRADEEQRRRQRKRDSVGDHFAQPAKAVVKVEERPTPPIPCAAAEEEPVAWLVEVSPKLAAVARRLCRQRKEMSCVVCGRRGYVAQVVVVAPQGARPRPPKRGLSVRQRE